MQLPTAETNTYSPTLSLHDALPLFTGPSSDTLAARLDGVWVKRDGFLHDVNNDRDINNRDRYFLRGQLLFEPTDALSVRLIADYTSREEECCGATYVGPSVNSYIGNLNNPSNLPYPPGTPVGNEDRKSTRLNSSP